MTAWQCRPDDALAVVPIGAPIANTTIHILDDRMRPVPIGIPGELYIGGVQVAVGYVNQRRSDRGALRPRSFDPGRPPVQDRRPGALAARRSGRLPRPVDTQVKLRGQRIELGEIEATLGEHPAVLEAAVTVVDTGGEPKLVAHSWAGRDLPMSAELRCVPRAPSPGAHGSRPLRRARGAPVDNQRQGRSQGARRVRCRRRPRAAPVTAGAQRAREFPPRHLVRCARSARRRAATTASSIWAPPRCRRPRSSNRVQTRARRVHLRGDRLHRPDGGRVRLLPRAGIPRSGGQTVRRADAGHHAGGRADARAGRSRR